MLEIDLSPAYEPDYDPPEDYDAAPPDPEPYEADSGTVSTWRPVDLAETVAGLLDGTLTRPRPSVGHLDDGRSLFYRGRVNGIAGESTAGKTWTALHACRQELDAGSVALFIDHEDGAAGIVARLLDLGTDPAAILDRFVYVNATERPTRADLDALAELVDVRQPTVVVIDSAGEGLALDGANPNADEDVAVWFHRLPRRLARIEYSGQPGPAVVLLDHVTKAAEDGPKMYAIGSQRKRGAITGAQYMQRVVEPFDKDRAGRAVLVCAKDRGGNYRQGRKVAELHAEPLGDGRLSLDLTPAGRDDPAESGRFRPTGYMERVSQAVEQAPGPVTFNGIVDRLRAAGAAKREVVRVAVDLLIGEGYVLTTDGPRNSTMHTSTRPFRESDDPGPVTSPADWSTGPVPIGLGPETSGFDWSRDQSGTSGDQSLTCTICRQPMTDLGDGATTHPTCSETDR